MNTKDVKELKIHGKTYKVKWIDGIESECSIGDFSGKSKPGNQWMAIQRDMPDETKLEVILHEVLHAIDADLHLELEEGTVQRLGCSLAWFMLDNLDFKFRRKR